MDRDKWVVYLVRCSDNSLYCGATNDLEKRLAAHNSGKGAKYTRSRGPVKLVAAGSEMTKSEALKLEYRVKRVPAHRKHHELKNYEDQILLDLRKTLKAVASDIRILVNKVDELVKSINDD